MPPSQRKFDITSAWQPVRAVCERLVEAVRDDRGHPHAAVEAEDLKAAVHAGRKEVVCLVRVPFEPPDAAHGLVLRLHQRLAQVPHVPDADALVVAPGGEHVGPSRVRLEAADAHSVGPPVGENGVAASLPRVPTLHLAVVGAGVEHVGRVSVCRDNPRLEVVRLPCRGHF